MNEEQDLTKQCVDCGEDWVLTAGEQRFFKMKGFDFPKRCKRCRVRKKQEKMAGEQAQGRQGRQFSGNNDGDFKL